TLALIICGIGLFSVSALMIRNRLKEIAVRKVLGAKSENVISLLLADKFTLVLLSSLVGSAITWYVMHLWLQDFAFKVHLTLLDFSLPLLTIIVIMIVSVGYHAVRAVRVDPASTLRSE